MIVSPGGPQAALPTVLRAPWLAIQDIMHAWYSAKMAIEHRSIIASDALHVLVGMAIWIGAAVLLRKRLSGVLPWVVVLAAILFNETVDLTKEHWPNASAQYRESIKDLLLTMILPTLLLLMMRTRPDLFQAQRTDRRR